MHLQDRPQLGRNTLKGDAMPLTAETIAKTIGGRKGGGCWIARCPGPDDREPTLSLRDADEGKVLVRRIKTLGQAKLRRRQ